MRTLHIEGVISRRDEAEKMAPGEKVFSFEDLENFLVGNGDAPFEAIIKSPGGSVEEGFKIYNRLRDYDVTTVAIKASSIASVIFLAGKTRKVTPKSEIIIHNAWVDAQDLAGEKLNYHTLKALTEFFAETDKKILGVYSQIAGEENIAKLFSLMAQDTDLGAEQALALGFATEMADGEFETAAFKNRVLTFSKNQIDIINLQEGPIKTYVDVIYLTEAGKVLMLQRKDSDDFEPGKWGFPGGKVMQGETTEEGAVREFKEETGIELKEINRFGEEVNEDESLTVYFYAVGEEIKPDRIPEHVASGYYFTSDFEKMALIKDQKDRFSKIINTIINKSQMKTEEKLNAFEKALAGLKNLFKLSAKNMATVTTEGVEIFISGAEEGELVGKTVYLAEDGLPTETPAPAGEHVLEDGTKVVLDDAGVITEIEAPEPVEDVEALKAAYEEEKKAMEEDKAKLEAKVAEQAKTIAAQAKAINESKTQLGKLAEDFASLKNLVTGDPEKKTGSKAISAEEFNKLSPGDKIRLRAMNKAGN
jgi:mutator protein MutT